MCIRWQAPLLAQRLLSLWLKCHKRVEVVSHPEVMGVMEVKPPIPKCQRKCYEAVSKWAIPANILRH